MMQYQANGSEAQEYAEDWSRRQERPQRSRTRTATRTATHGRPQPCTMMTCVRAMRRVCTVVTPDGVRETTQPHDAQAGGTECESEFVDVHRGCV